LGEAFHALQIDNNGEKMEQDAASMIINRFKATEGTELTISEHLAKMAEQLAPFSHESTKQVFVKQRKFLLYL
jgi:hypothetical protein